ncbi:DUF1517 domain-containing protein [Pseudanabaena yagii]|uniref:DUF1517 domain-containing protein n=1 Tax=Pseudanabaena yagii GIHE-NHR1 TaxID=2722753 RepID=A0ABX1LPY8_9CYAN|nr:DUF1517 domain-containing protein [Pseudanabaena yagii]NMF56904.1 DUF1517 domain-containing protein [Pseudanabaena yagii GIHE-NHR1]
MRKPSFHFLATTLLTFATIQAIALGYRDRQLDALLQQDQQAYAKSSAGRSSGGSFTRSAPSSSSSKSSSSSSSSSTSKPSSPSNSSSSSSPSSPSSSSDKDSFSSNQRPSSGNTIVAPVIIDNGYSRPNYSNPNSYYAPYSSSSTGTPWYVWLILLLIGGTITYFIIRALFFGSKPSVAKELENDTVTVTKLQVALLSQAREVQSRLTELSLEVDTDTSEGLLTLLQESALALIRTPENWTHVCSSSQSVKRDQAEGVFQKLSLAERSKFSHESLVNVGGRVSQRQAPIASPDKDPSAYIVVTLLIGTEHDKPLFGEIRNTQELRTALEAIAAIPDTHLLVFELLWSPQADSDSLTYDELLTEYTDMIQI